MTDENEPFHFKFSLEILNHLGRGLYRSFATVVAEAVSNSWDAEATKVEITIGEGKLIVEDNGKGMNSKDFQEKFLEVGYSRRQDKSNKSKRNIIGRKGIGKLAMLSISDKITILSKKEGQEVTGGKINNPKLDKKIKDKGDYSLENLSDKEKKRLFGKTKKTGTKIIFEGIKTNLNKEEIIRKYLATQFNFIFSLKKDDRFNIIVNNKKVTKDDLKELNDNTQFIWFLGKEDKKRKGWYKNLVKHIAIEKTFFKFNKKDIKIKGFIASVILPTHLLLRGSGGDFKASINLFCNGRLRQENLFEEITSKRVVEEYLYGEIHVDGFEDGEIDRFTSSREGVIKNDPLYQKFLKKLKEVQTQILADWDKWRREIRQEGDIENKSIPKYQRRLEDSKNWREKDFKNKIDENIKDESIKKTLKEKLKNLSYKNTQVYQDIFILENIFREYIKLKNIKERDLNNLDEAENDIIESLKLTKKFRQEDEERHILKGKIVKEEHYLNYLDLCDLAEIIDIKIHKIQNKKKKNQKGLDLDAKEINPVRNPVMHTNEITDDVLEWDKIKNVIDYIERLNNKTKNK